VETDHINTRSLTPFSASMANVYSRTAYTFNAAGVNSFTTLKYGGNIFAGSTAANISAYYVDGEALHTVQHVTPAADGTQITLYAQGNPFGKHRISTVIGALSKEVEQKCK